MEENSPVQSDPGKQSLLLWILWIALMIAIAIYAGIGSYAGQKMTLSQSEDILPMMTTIFLVFAGFETIFVLVFAGKVFAKSTNYMTYCIFRWAIAESIGIFGLVLMFMGPTTSTGFIFIVWSLALLLVLMPNQGNRDRFEKASNKGIHP